MSYSRPNHGLWTIDFSTISHVDPQYVKEMMIKCFMEAQKEAIARVKEKFGREVSEESIYKSIESLVKMTFKSVGADFNNPRRRDCELVIQNLYKKARAMGTPQDIADHHVDQLMRLLDLCPH